MSIDRSLRVRGKLTGKRSVMKRDERVAKLIADKKMDAKAPKAIGLPKTLAPKV